MGIAARFHNSSTRNLGLLRFFQGRMALCIPERYISLPVLTPPSSGQIRITVSSAQVDPKDPPYTEPSTLPRVTDFCQYLQQPAQTAVGFCVDDAGSLRLYPSVSPAIQYVNQCATLETLLPELQGKLPLEELYCLAITLVASVFQLSHTPWLHQEWTKKDIAFLRASSNLSLEVDIKYPYLVRDFSQSKR